MKEVVEEGRKRIGREMKEVGEMGKRGKKREKGMGRERNEVIEE